MKHMISLLGLLIAFTIHTNGASASGINCEKAKTAAELAICNDDWETLKLLDAMLAKVYNQFVVRLSEQFPITDGSHLPHNYSSLEEFHNDQKAWISSTNDCLGDYACITDKYRHRIKKLASEYVVITIGKFHDHERHYTKRDVVNDPDCLTIDNGELDEMRGLCVGNLPNIKSSDIIIADGYLALDYYYLNSAYYDCGFSILYEQQADKTWRKINFGSQYDDYDGFGPQTIDINLLGGITGGLNLNVYPAYCNGMKVSGPDGAYGGKRIIYD